MHVRVLIRKVSVDARPKIVRQFGPISLVGLGKDDVSYIGAASGDDLFFDTAHGKHAAG